MSEACAFAPPNEPWECSVHQGGIRGRRDEPQCDIARPAEPLNEARLDNLRQSVTTGKRLPNHYLIRRLLANIAALEGTLADIAPRYHDLAISDDATHPAVPWELCADALCVNARVGGPVAPTQEPAK